MMAHVKELEEVCTRLAPSPTLNAPAIQLSVAQNQVTSLQAQLDAQQEQFKVMMATAEKRYAELEQRLSAQMQSTGQGPSPAQTLAPCDASQNGSPASAVPQPAVEEDLQQNGKGTGKGSSALAQY